MLRVGMIGCGLVAARHVRSFAALGDRAAVVATCDRDLAKARATAELAGAERVVADYHELLADPNLDAVAILLPHHLHREAVLAAVAAGKHILCEKPIATTLADADALIAATDRSDRVFMIAEQSHFDPCVPVVRELVARGVIGRPILALTVASWLQGGAYLDTAWRFDVAEMGGGMLIDGGIHKVALLTSLLGRPRRVSCLTRRVREEFPAEDTACLTLELPDGLLAELVITWSSEYYEDSRFRVIGTDGALVARRGGVEQVGGRHAPATEHPVEAVDLYAAEVAHFVECVETGARPRVDGRQARLDLEVVLAAYESARTGRVVELPAS